VAAQSGVEGQKARFEQADAKQKCSMLAEAVQYGEEGLLLLWHGLKDADLKVRSQAYLLLKAVDVKSPELGSGIPLRVGDRIYGVYQSCVERNSEDMGPSYYIRHFVDGHREFPFYREGKTKNGKFFEYVSDAPKHQPSHSDFGFCHPRLICYCFEQAVAEEAAKVAYCDKLNKLPCSIDELTEYSIGGLTEYSIDELTDDILVEMEADSVDLKVKALAEAHDVKLVVEVYENPNTDSDWAYYHCLLLSLQQQQQFDLLRELWELLKFRPLGFVHKHIIDRNCYLELS
jgi:hypothetical protein